MKSAKDLSRTLQESATKFGYDLKLTHCQEILANLAGFANRHALLTADPQTFDTFVQENFTVGNTKESKEEGLNLGKYFLVQIGKLDPMGKDPYLYLSFPQKMTEEQVLAYVIKEYNLSEDDIFEIEELESKENWEQHQKDITEYLQIKICGDESRIVILELSLKYYQYGAQEKFAIKKAISEGKITKKEAEDCFSARLSREEYDKLKFLLDNPTLPGLDGSKLTIKKSNYTESEFAKLQTVIDKYFHKLKLNGLNVKETKTSNVYSLSYGNIDYLADFVFHIAKYLK